MIVKEVLNEEILTLSEVKFYLEEILNDRKKNNEEEQVYEFRKALNHATIFSKLSISDSKDIVNRLKEENIKTSIAVRIVDILPESKDELRSIFYKEKYIFKEEELNKILSILKEYI